MRWMTWLTSLRVRTTWSEAVRCCWVASEISRAARAVSVRAPRRSAIAAAAERARSRTRAASLLPSSVATTVARIEPANSSSSERTDATDSCERCARRRTSSATTEKRRPCSPAAAASIVALRESRWVSWAISVMSSSTR